MKKFKIAVLVLPMLCSGVFSWAGNPLQDYLAAANGKAYTVKEEAINIEKEALIGKEEALTIKKEALIAKEEALTIKEEARTAKDKFVGGWSYTVANAPQGYEKGFLVIVKEGDGYKVQVQVGGGNLLGENVKVSGKTISFDVMIEGGKVAVELSVKGDTISGKSTSSEGTYNIEGERTLAMN